MYTTSSEYNLVVAGPSRQFTVKVVVGEQATIVKGISKYKYTGGSCRDDNISIGTTVSAYVEMELSNPGVTLENKEIELLVGMQLSDSIEYIPVGKFTVQKLTESDKSIKLIAHDKMTRAEGMPYFSDLVYPTTTIKMLQEICTKLGISLATINLETITIPAKMDGYTCREMLGYLAALHGKFACINRSGDLEIRWYMDGNYHVNPNRYFTLPTNQNDFSVNKIECSVDNNTTLTAGSGYTGISISNPLMTQERLDDIYNALNGFTFLPGSCKFLGDPRLDAWDIATVTDLYGDVCKIPAMLLTQEFDGGIATTIEAKGKTEQESQNNFKGPATKAIERSYAELLLVKTLLVDKADIEYLQANYATINSLTAVSGRIDSLESNTATIVNLNAATARITDLEANSLTATSALIHSLTSDVADINALMFGSASGGSLTTEFSNSVVGLIGDAQIKSAMIQNLDVSKINAGNISTTKFNLQSDSGRLAIADNTLFIKDANRTRVQIGKDASNDYSMYVWDKDGNLMFDALGLTQSGITRKIIRNDVVADNANINASKLDISSLFTQINGSTQTIKSSKILVDAENQTLDVAFTNMSTSVSTVNTTASNAQNVANSAKTTADAIKSTADNALSTANTVSANLTTLTNTVTTQGTQISAVQGSISNKIWQQDITTAVTGLNYENRNLLTGTKSWDNLQGDAYNWAYYTVYTVDGLYKGLTVRKSVNHQWEGIAKRYQAEVGYYTFSCYVKTTSDANAVIFALPGATNTPATINGANVFDFHALTAWTRISFTFNVTTAGNLQCRVENSKATGTIWVCGHKLEKGTKATNYSEAPEDTDASILALQGTTTTLSNNYTTLNQTLTSLSGTVNSHTSTIAQKADSSVVTSLSNNITAIQADLNGYKTTVSSTYSTKAEFNNLQVGGRNLIIDTNKEDVHHLVWGLAQGGVTYTHSVVFGTHCWTLKRDNVANTGWNYIGIYGLNRSHIEPATYYTLSFDVLSTARSTNIDFGIVSGSTSNKMTNSTATGAIKTIEPNVWTKIVLTIKTLADMAAPNDQIIYMSNFNRDINVAHTFRNIKLEKGTKNTDWSPAPEDTDSAIATVDNKFQNYSTTMQMNSAIEQKSDSILFDVKGSYVTKTDYVSKVNDLQASLNVKVDSDKLISSITGSANVINFTSHNFSWTSTYSSMTADGVLTATSGKLGAWNLSATDMYNDNGNMSAGIGKYLTSPAFWAGASYGNRMSSPFIVGHDGALTATTGTIGAWKLSSTDLYNDNGGWSAGVGKFLVSPAFWAGASYADRANAPFTVGHDGAVTCNNFKSNSAVITGGSININTSDLNYSAITLHYAGAQVLLAPGRIIIGTEQDGVLIYNGGIYIVSGGSQIATFNNTAGYSGPINGMYGATGNVKAASGEWLNISGGLIVGIN